MTDDNQYIKLRYRNLLVQVKFDDEGVVVDLFDITDSDDPQELATSWRLYSELPIERKDVRKEFPCKARPLYWSKTYDGHCEREAWECEHCLKIEKEREAKNDNDTNEDNDNRRG